MLPYLVGVATFSAIAYAGKVISDYLCDGIEKSEARKRARIRKISAQVIRKNEYEKRGLLLDSLTKLQAEAWEEVHLLEENKNKLNKQLKRALRDKKVVADFQARHNNLDFIQFLIKALILNDLREYYWHRIIKKCSEKKHELTTSSLDTKKFLRKKILELPDYNQLISNMPIKGQFAEAKLISRLQKGLKFEFFDGFSSIIPNFQKEFVKGCRIKSKKKLFVKTIDYVKKTIEVDTVKTYLLDQIEQIGINKFTFQPKIINENRKEEKIMGYNLDYNGIDLFLPISLTRNKLDKAGGKLSVKFANGKFDPNRLIVEQV